MTATKTTPRHPPAPVTTVRFPPDPAAAPGTRAVDRLFPARTTATVR
ncbi:hypothetical protein AB0M80_43820 [Amycolatopsis sp. NPDC051045]